jgi:hypothetical protein
MAVSTLLYRPTLIDEHLDMRDVDKDGDLDATLCRAAATAMALDAMTNGEWTRTVKGDRWGRARIKTLLQRMRMATGEPLRSGYNQSHVDEFVRGAGFPTDIIRIYNKPMKDIKGKLKDGFTVTLAGDVRGTPVNSPLRRYVNPGVGHEIIITRVSGDGTRAAFIDPMTRHGTVNYERWAPWSHFVGFAKRFVTGGNAIAEIWKRGRLTEAKEVARDRARVIEDLQGRLLRLSKEWEKQQRELITCDETIQKLSGDLADCRQLSVHDHVGTADKISKARELLALAEADLM